MSLESVRADLASRAPDLEILHADSSTATVALAAEAFGVEPGRIAKTLSLSVGGQALLVIASGDRRLDNRKVRSAFGGKGRMLGADDVLALTGHPVGGVCPFGLATPLPVYCDVSLRVYDEILPAAGSLETAVRITPTRLAELVGARWVDVCRDPDPDPEPDADPRRDPDAGPAAPEASPA
jgi:prolyl-tRNA editing enzyme YbaK/EbsC (Cys-tRNA(Pro) deacylase)